MASAHHAQSALSDVRSGVLCDALYHGAGARVLADRARTLQSTKTAEGRAGDPDSAGHSRCAPLHAASIVAGHALSDRPREAASLLVQPAAASFLLPFGDRRGTCNDNLRIVAEFEAFRVATGTARPAGTRARSRSGARRLRDPSRRRPGESRRSSPGISSRIRDVSLLA